MATTSINATTMATPAPWALIRTDSVSDIDMQAQAAQQVPPCELSYDKPEWLTPEWKEFSEMCKLISLPDLYKPTTVNGPFSIVPTALSQEEGYVNTLDSTAVLAYLNNLDKATMQERMAMVERDTRQARKQQTYYNYISMQPFYFDLLRSNGEVAYSHVQHCLGQLPETTQIMDHDYLSMLQIGVKQRMESRVETTFGFMAAPPNENINKKVIGKNGHYFKITTTNCNVDFIWHHRETNNFFFWGEKQCVIRAMHKIRNRILANIPHY